MDNIQNWKITDPEVIRMIESWGKSTDDFMTHQKAKELYDRDVEIYALYLDDGGEGRVNDWDDGDVARSWDDPFIAFFTDFDLENFLKEEYDSQLYPDVIPNQHIDIQTELYNYVQRFIQDHKIENPEQVYDSPFLTKHLRGFLETCCEIVGYHKTEEHETEYKAD